MTRISLAPAPSPNWLRFVSFTMDPRAPLSISQMRLPKFPLVRKCQILHRLTRSSTQTHLSLRASPPASPPPAKPNPAHLRLCYPEGLTRLVLLALPLFLALSRIAAAQPAALLDAMSQELNRNFSALKEKADP